MICNICGVNETVDTDKIIETTSVEPEKRHSKSRWGAD